MNKKQIKKFEKIMLHSDLSIYFNSNFFGRNVVLGLMVEVAKWK